MKFTQGLSHSIFEWWCLTFNSNARDLTQTIIEMKWNPRSKSNFTVCEFETTLSWDLLQKWSCVFNLQNWRARDIQLFLELSRTISTPKLNSSNIWVSVHTFVKLICPYINNWYQLPVIELLLYFKLVYMVNIWRIFLRLMKHIMVVLNSGWPLCSRIYLQFVLFLWKNGAIFMSPSYYSRRDLVQSMNIKSIK